MLVGLCKDYTSPILSDLNTTDLNQDYNRASYTLTCKQTGTRLCPKMKVDRIPPVLDWSGTGTNADRNTKVAPIMSN